MIKKCKGCKRESIETPRYRQNWTKLANMWKSKECLSFTSHEWCLFPDRKMQFLFRRCEILCTVTSNHVSFQSCIHFVTLAWLLYSVYPIYQGYREVHLRVVDTVNLLCLNIYIWISPSSRSPFDLFLLRVHVQLLLFYQLTIIAICQTFPIFSTSYKGITAKNHWWYFWQKERIITHTPINDWDFKYTVGLILMYFEIARCNSLHVWSILIQMKMYILHRIIIELFMSIVCTVCSNV